MKQRFTETRRGMTILELLVVLVIIALLFFLIARDIVERPDRTMSTMCMSNQKQVALANFIWLSGHMNRFPWQVSVEEGGSLEYTNVTLPHFQVLSNCVGYPELLVCPSDSARASAKTYFKLSRTNLSYFINLDANTKQPLTAFLTGDRHFALSNQPVRSGLFLLRGDEALSWTGELHKNKRHALGVLSFADGHVERIWTAKLHDAIDRQPLGTNRLVVP